MPEELSPLLDTSDLTLYRVSGSSDLDRLVVSCPETRSICNDPNVLGTSYTRLLSTACTKVLNALKRDAFGWLKASDTVVLNVLRGGLNFGLREAVADAFGFVEHSAAFISAQRVKDQASNEWHISEKAYQKVYLPKRATIIFGDVVATGTSLQYALREIVRIAKQNSCLIEGFVFLTIGGVRSEEILAEIDVECRRDFPDYRQSWVIYLEGRFAVAQEHSPLSIKIAGTDLLRRDSLLAPEFFQSQYESPAYPLERCTIYDAGSRAYCIEEYITDVRSYWEGVARLVLKGMDFSTLLAERMPELDARRFGAIDLAELALAQLKRLSVS